MFWSGNRTRDKQISDLSLYPTELSSGGRTGFEPAADGFRRCSASELPSSRNTFSHASAYATAKPRAPDGIASRTAGTCSIDIPYCRLSPTGNSYRRIAPHASQTQPRAARVEASPRGAHAPVAAAPLPRPRSIARPDASGRKVFSVGWFCRTLALHALPLRTLETKRPRDLRPEGVRVASGDRVADLPGSPTVIRCAGTGCVRRGGDRRASCMRAHPRRGRWAAVQRGSR